MIFKTQHYICILALIAGLLGVQIGLEAQGTGASLSGLVTDNPWFLQQM